MTQLLYLEDSYLKEFSAEVIETIVKNEKFFVVLNQTAFYPQGGGQVYDTGKLINENNEEFKLISCIKKEGKVLHETDKPGLKKGDKIKCLIDWERRYKLMRSHTATHILAEAIFKETGALITGNQIDIDKCRIDFDLENNDQKLIKNAIEKANKVINKNLDIKIEFKSREEAFKISQLSKLAMGLPESIQEVRIVSIGDYDMQADGGTHVHNTREIGQIEFIKTDNRGKNNRRVYFKII